MGMILSIFSMIDTVPSRRDSAKPSRKVNRVIDSEGESVPSVRHKYLFDTATEELPYFGCPDPITGKANVIDRIMLHELSCGLKFYVKFDKPFKTKAWIPAEIVLRLDCEQQLKEYLLELEAHSKRKFLFLIKPWPQLQDFLLGLREWDELDNSPSNLEQLIERRYKKTSNRQGWKTRHSFKEDLDISSFTEKVSCA